MIHLPPSELDRIAAIAYSRNHPLKTLWQLFRGQRHRLAWALFAFVVKQSPVWIMPILLANIINAVMAGGPALRFNLIVNAIIMVVVLVQNIPMHTLYAYKLSKSVREVQLLVRAALLLRLQQFSMSFYVRFHGGRMHAKILRDVEVIQILSRAAYDTILNCICSTVATLIIIATKGQWGIMLFFLGTTPFAITLTWIFRKQVVNRNAAFRTGLEAISSDITEMIDMVPITRAHALEEMESRRVRAKLQQIRIAGTRLDTINELFGACNWVTFNLFTFVCFMFTILLVLRHRIPIGDVVMYQSLFTMVIGTISNTMLLYPQLATGGESLRSIGEILEHTELENHHGKIALPTLAGGFKLDHVSYQYPGAPDVSLQDFSLDVQPGECVAIIGESGSGKSTLMSIIIGFHRPSSGTIHLDGHDMTTLDLRSFRQHLAVVPQQVHLFSGTIRENITYGLDDVTDAAIAQALETANATEFINRLPHGIDTPIGPHGATLSGGQRQRLAIARALVRNPKVIILDEATSGLDVVSEQLVQEAVNRLIRGRTTFIVAHRMSTIRHADKVVILERGRIIECGSPSELTQKNGLFSRLKNLQT